MKNIIENRYDVVITDLNLPDVNGMEFIGQIRALMKDTPVIVMSAYFSDPAMDDIYKYDVFRCVHKPFEISDIMSNVKEEMKHRGTENSNQRPV